MRANAAVAAWRASSGEAGKHSHPHGHAHVDLRVLLRRVDAGLSVVPCRRGERRNAAEPE